MIDKKTFIIDPSWCYNWF